MTDNNIRKYLLLSIFLFVNLLSASENSYVANIDSLVKEADAVKLSEQITFNVLDEKSAEYTRTAKILIKNKNADNYCRVVLRESEFETIEDIEAVIKDTLGNVIKELDSDDIREAEASINNFYSGDLYNWFELTHHTYPYVFEYTIKKEYESLFFWPNWSPQSGIPTRFSEYKLINEENIDFSFYPVGIDFEPDIIEHNEGKIYTWQVRNLPKVRKENYMPPENRFQIGILFKSKIFNLDDYTGSSENWQKFAEFYNSLTEGRYQLPEKAKTEITALVSNITDKKEKVKILYDHLKEKNRYVDIELGISGWQPQSASDVYVNRYGDCKDLSTYMVAILNHAGIDAYPALALTRNSGMVKLDFPSSQFNHCITMVPIEEDTVWLECTASYIDMEDTPYSIEDINALVVLENGGKMIRTSQKSSTQNVSKSKIYGTLKGNGNFQFEAEINRIGNPKNSLKSKLIANSKKDDIILLQNVLNKNYTNITVDNYNINELNDESGQYNVGVAGTYKKFVSTRGKRMFLNPNIYNRETEEDIPDEDVDERKYPIFYYYPFVDIDSVSINIPFNYNLESIPKEKNIDYPFAKYTATYNYRDGILNYARFFEIKENIIPVEKYSEYLDFLKFVIKADKSKLVFVKK